MKKIRCAIYTRKSSEEGLDQDFNSLDTQREACAAYVSSQKAEGWVLLPDHYDDGGKSGGTLDRPSLQQLLRDVDEGKVDQIVVYKIDRLTRSLADFAKLVDRLDNAHASFVSVTQSFNTATSMGRLTLNVLLSFAQFEREVTAERIKDKIAASKRKGLWMGGMVPLGYDADGRTLKPNEQEAKTVQSIYNLYLEHRTIRKVKEQAVQLGLLSKSRFSKRTKKTSGGNSFGLGHIHAILTNPIYAGRIRHKKNIYEGKHPPIIKPELFDKVQTLLQQQSRKPRGKPQSPYSSPYVGKLFDETGDRLTPSHANKKGIRHRYYVSRRLIEGTTNKQLTGSINNDRTINDGWRLPARPLEEAIARLIHERLTSSDFTKLIIKNLSPAKAAMRIERTKQLATAITTKPAKAAQLTKSIQIKPGHITITLDPNQIAKKLKISLPQIDNNHDDNHFDDNHFDDHESHIEVHTDNNARGSLSSITAPFQLRKRGVETKLIIGGLNNELDHILIKNIAKAQQWYQAIKQGTTFDQIAEQEHASIARMRQMINHAFIAPEIVKSVLDGYQPIDFTSNFIQRNALPSDWRKQHDLLSRL